MFRVIYDSDIRTTLSRGGETVYVQGNNDTVQGGRGEDWIATALRDDEPAGLSTDLSGGQGDDTLQAVLTLDGEGYSYSDDIGALSAILAGGRGNDVIEVSTSALNANQSVTVTGGAGADTIDVNVDIRDPSGSYSSFAGS